MKRDQLIVALDVENFAAAKKNVGKLSPTVSFYKVGLRLFIKEGPPIIRWLKQKKCKIFLDLKLHDIPNTVAQSIESIQSLGVDFVTVHASGGVEMMKGAVESARKSARRLKIKPVKILAVTVLTSMNSLKPFGISSSISDQVIRLAGLAKQSGVDGVVCSPLEIKLVRKKIGQSLKIITPGIRLSDDSSIDSDDQKRIATPELALQDGADYLVVGRPILSSSDPIKVVHQILKS